MNAHLDPQDLQLIATWAATLAEHGTAPSRIGRLTKRTRGFLGATGTSLLAARREDIARFAAARAARLHDGHVDPLKVTLRGRSLRETVEALRAFYTWAAARGLVDPRRAPTTGLHLPPKIENRRRVQGRRHDALLQVDGQPMDVAIVWLLAHGLRPREFLRLKPDDVDLEAREVRLPGRTMPLTPAAVAAVAPWIETRRTFYAASLLFAGPRTRRPGPMVAREALRRLAQRGGLRYVRATTFRDLFVSRALKRGVALDCAPELLGIALPALRPYLRPPSRDRLHRELHRVTRRWRRWIG